MIVWRERPSLTPRRCWSVDAHRKAIAREAPTTVSTRASAFKSSTKSSILGRAFRSKCSIGAPNTGSWSAAPCVCDRRRWNVPALGKSGSVYPPYT